MFDQVVMQLCARLIGEQDYHRSFVVGGVCSGVAAAQGESVTKCPSPLNVLKYKYDHSCY